MSLMCTHTTKAGAHTDRHLRAGNKRCLPRCAPTGSCSHLPQGYSQPGQLRRDVLSWVSPCMRLTNTVGHTGQPCSRARVGLDTVVVPYNRAGRGCNCTMCNADTEVAILPRDDWAEEGLSQIVLQLLMGKPSGTVAAGTSQLQGWAGRAHMPVVLSPPAHRSSRMGGCTSTHSFHAGKVHEWRGMPAISVLLSLFQSCLTQKTSALQDARLSPCCHSPKQVHNARKPVHQEQGHPAGSQLLRACGCQQPLFPALPCRHLRQPWA